MTKKHPIYFLAFLVTMALLASPAKAQHAHDHNDPPQDIESVGTYAPGHPKSLGPGIYHNASRSGLSNALKHIGLGRRISLERKINDFLLTSADASALNNDIEKQDTNNLFTLRLNALLKRGLNNEAFALYTQISDIEDHEKLVRLGVYSMLFNQEKALACLEVKARFTDFENIALWQELNGYCSHTLSMKDETSENIQISSNIVKSIIASPDYTFEYTPQTFASLKFLEKAILTAEDRITISTATSDMTFPPRDIQPLLQQTRINIRNKTLLSLHAAKGAITPPDDITEKYEALHTHYKDKNAAPKNTLAKLSLLQAHADATWSDKKRKQTLEKAFTLSPQYGAASLIPFVPTFEKANVGEEISITNMHEALNTFLYAGKPVPKKWIKELQKLSEKEDNQKTKEDLQKFLFLAILLSDTPIEKDFSFKDYDLSAYFSSGSYTADLKNIIENIDSQQNNGDKLRYVYNSGFDLLNNNGYKMPSFVLINALEQSSRNQDIRATLLLSSLILSNIAPNELYSGTLSDVIVAMNKIGFKDVSYRILAQAVLERDN